MKELIVVAMWSIFLGLGLIVVLSSGNESFMWGYCVFFGLSLISTSRYMGQILSEWYNAVFGGSSQTTPEQHMWLTRVAGMCFVVLGGLELAGIVPHK